MNAELGHWSEFHKSVVDPDPLLRLQTKICLLEADFVCGCQG
jgi:hypothetical protein